MDYPNGRALVIQTADNVSDRLCETWDIARPVENAGPGPAGVIPGRKEFESTHYPGRSALDIIEACFDNKQAIAFFMRRRVAQTASRVPRVDNRKHDVMDVAARLFRERGFHATSTRDIARATGMLPGSIYYHFASKEELLAQVYEEGTRRIVEAVDGAIVGETDPWRRLEAAATAHLEMLLGGSDYAQVVIRVLPQDVGEAGRRLSTLRASYERRFRQLLSDLDLPPEVDLRYLRLFLLGGMNWAQFWFKPKGDTPKIIARHFIDFVRRQASGAEASG